MLKRSLSPDEHTLPAGNKLPPVLYKKPRNERGDDILSLNSLLDLSDVSSSFEERFLCIATTLSQSYVIIVQVPQENSDSQNETKLDILELEFYLWQSDIHPDPYTHCSEEQKIAGQWCFHRTPKHSQTDDTEHVLVGNSGYRGGTRKGLDLSFGCVPDVTSPYFPQSSKSVPDDKPSLHGGILLRTIRDQSTGRIISGPSLLVDHVLKLSGAGSITELVDEKWGGDIRALHGAKDRTCMYLRRRSSEQTCTIYTSPRIGLDLSHPSAKAAMTNSRAQYVAKPYRYFSQPKLLTANGRTQTMLGLWRDVEVRGALLKRSREVMVDELCDVTGMKRKTADGYLTEYMKGVEGKVNLEDFVGREKGKGVSTSATRYLQMIGCIHREQSRTT